MRPSCARGWPATRRATWPTSSRPGRPGTTCPRAARAWRWPSRARRRSWAERPPPGCAPPATAPADPGSALELRREPRAGVGQHEAPVAHRDLLAVEPHRRGRRAVYDEVERLARELGV